MTGFTTVLRNARQCQLSALPTHIAAKTHVALLVSTESTTNSRLGAVSGSVTLLVTVVTLHRGSLNSLVLAFGRSVTGLLAVVADVLSTAGGAGETTGTTSGSARGAGGGDVAETTKRSPIRISNTTSGMRTSGRTRSCSKSCHHRIHPDRPAGTHRHRPGDSFG